ncbi:hypothetical protein D186_23676 [Citrobacter freundii ATCC 8090 = MTCC 1658 = NBRC 12681]|uniref:hypothetical protein n=1 Tax=Citrobacter freundii TaxID=546 RepID=UPI000299BAA8|nr:hypothetical protein [Citrobacter freundii]EKS54280.1 hypothetical protein D186_23676 [Citrobacter freundii ATCC 8090 = MTCC 1658 = NBRC 12681]
MQATIHDIMYSLSTAVITLLATYALYYIRKGIAKVQSEAELIRSDQQRQMVMTAIKRLDDVATKTVRAIEQTTAKELREAVKSGKASPEELKQLARHAFNEIYAQLGPEYLGVLTATLGDIDQYIRNTIEAKVLEMKEGI